MQLKIGNLDPGEVLKFAAKRNMSHSERVFDYLQLVADKLQWTLRVGFPHFMLLITPRAITIVIDN